VRRCYPLAIALCMLALACRSEPVPTPDLVATQVVVLVKAYATLTAEAPTPRLAPSPTTAPAPTAAPAPASSTPPVATDTPEIKPTATVCISVAGPTGEANHPINIRKPPPERVSPGQRITISFASGYTWIPATQVVCGTMAVGWEHMSGYHGLGDPRPVRVLLDGELLASTECGYECRVEFAIPTTISPGPHELELQAHPNEVLFQRHFGGPTTFSLKVLEQESAEEDGATVSNEPVPIKEGYRPPADMRHALREQIVFHSENPEQPGLWAMDPTGGNRRWVGPLDQLTDQYYALREAERFAPDGKMRVFVKDADPEAQIFIYRPPSEQFGPLPDVQITHHTGLSYDPVWSPDGSRIAYVSTENGSDDIWVVYADGEGATWLVKNDWEWDKHPSWSPDGKRIVFWSNRHGLKQIFVMDADGQNVQLLSGSEWDEYDPIWIK
jgi:hypothetical protein